MRNRTARRMLAPKREPRTPTPFTGVTCPICRHYAHLVSVQGQVQVICNSNGRHVCTP